MWVEVGLQISGWEGEVFYIRASVVLMKKGTQSLLEFEGDRGVEKWLELLP